MTAAFWWRFLLCLWAGHWLLRWLARAPDDRRLRHVVLASFWLRAALGVMLYTISYRHWPILRSLQVQDGFWTFALDARLYHEWGAWIADAWTYGVELPDPAMRYEYLAIIASVYRLLGAHPLYAILLHGWLGALTGWLAYRIGERLFDRRSALRAACLVGFWPSSLLWSSQILKDTLSWCLILTILWLVALTSGPDVRPLRRRVLQVAALAAATILLTRLRLYLSSILALAALVTLVPAGCACLVRRPRRVRRALWLGSLAALMIGAGVVGRALNTTRFVSPIPPEEGRLRLGISYQQRGDLARAEAEFRRAITLQPEYQPAYLVWAKMLFAAGRLREALEICAGSPGVARDPAMRQLVDEIEARLGEAALIRQPSSTPMSTRAQEALATLPEPARLPNTDASAPAARIFQSTPVSEPASQDVRAGVDPSTLPEPVATPPPAPGPTARIAATRQLLNQGLTLIGEMSPRWLGSIRSSAVAVGGGHALIDEEIDISQPGNLIAYLPRALIVGFLAPFPSEWFDTKGSTGIMRVFAGGEMALLVYPLLIGLALRAWRTIRLFGLIGFARRAWHAIRRAQVGLFFLLVYGLAVAASASLVMANLGTLFRLRLLFWLPLLIPLAAIDPLGSFPWYRRLIDWIAWPRGVRRALAASDRHGDHALVGGKQDATTPPEAVAGARGDGRS